MDHLLDTAPPQPGTELKMLEILPRWRAKRVGVFTQPQPLHNEDDKKSQVVKIHQKPNNFPFFFEGTLKKNSKKTTLGDGFFSQGP